LLPSDVLKQEGWLPLKVRGEGAHWKYKILKNKVIEYLKEVEAEDE